MRRVLVGEVLCKVLTHTVGLLSVSVALTVVAVSGITGAHHSTKMVGALLLAGGASTHIIVCNKAFHYNYVYTRKHKRVLRQLFCQLKMEKRVMG